MRFFSKIGLLTAAALGRLRIQSRLRHAFVVALLFVTVAWLDLILDSDLSLFALYLIPTLYATWFLGTRWGTLSCLASAVVWVVDDWGEARFYHHFLIPYWNVAERLVVLAVIVGIVKALKSSLEDEHEAERKVTRRELEIACEVQTRLLPHSPPHYPGLDVGFFYRPAREVGGDYYDFTPLDGGCMGLAVGDVSGKGLSSALLMASLQGLVRTSLAAREGRLSAFVEELNNAMYKLTAMNRYATFFFARVDVPKQTLTFVNAGHNPPLVWRRDSEAASILEAGGPPIGLFADSQYQSGEIPICSGDVVVAYTDGVVEALNAAGEEFGEEALQTMVQAYAGLDAGELCKKLEGRLLAFMADAPQWDDITLVVMKVVPIPE